MKLLIYSHYFAPSIGGVETIVMSLARGLAELRTAGGAQEFDLTVVTQTPRDNFDDTTLPFPVVRRPGFWKLLGLINRADVVHLAGPSFLPMLVAWLLRKPTAIEHHTYQSICPNGLLIHQPERSVCPGHFQAGNYSECWKCRSVEVSSLRALVDVAAAFPRQALVRKATVNIAVSEHVRKRLAVPRSSVIQHGVEDSRPTVSQSSGKVCFAFLGRFVPEKGIPVFLRAISLLHQEGLEFDAILVGDGPERSAIERQINEANLGTIVRWTGYLSGNDLSTALSRANVVVMPSVWEETAGLAAMEQMMRGRLVIASDLGGVAEVIEDAGLRFRTGDAVALAHCLRKVIQSPEIAEELGSRARARATELFLRSRMIEEHGSTYRVCYATGRKS